MHTNITRGQALKLLKKYNQEPFHLLHALTVEAVMRYLAVQLGYADETDFWGLCGLLHDIDFEKFPQEHCKKAPELLAEIKAEPELIRAICSHGYGITVNVKPEHEMEKVLFATDELTGLIGAAAKMRPSKSTQDMEVSSLKKKFKDKKFAAGCSRDVIKQGAEMFDWPLEELFEKTSKYLCELLINNITELILSVIDKAINDLSGFFYSKTENNMKEIINHLHLLSGYKIVKKEEKKDNGEIKK